MAADRIGLIGLGLLGSAIAERLLGHGTAVLGFDIEEARCRVLAAIGGTALDSAADVARKCDRLILCLPDSGVSGRVLGRIDRHLLEGTHVMDATTGSPDDAASFAEALATRDCRYLDTTVGGSSDLVRRGEAIIIAGGDANALRRCLPVLRIIARRVFHAGPCGAGASMKLVLNLVLGLHRAVLAEGLSLAAGFGLSLERTLEVLGDGPAYSVAMDHKGQKMISGDFAPQARLRQHLKDVRLILESGRRTGVRLPLSEQHAALLERAESMGFGDADNSAVIRAFD